MKKIKTSLKSQRAVAKKLSPIIKEIQSSFKYNDINCGGCIHFAYYLSEKLKSLNIEHEVVGLFSHGDSMEDLFFGGCTHVVVYVPRLGYIDSKTVRTEIRSYSFLSVRKITFPKDLDLNALRNSRNAWNTVYNLGYNSTISRVINSHFKNFSL